MEAKGRGGLYVGTNGEYHDAHGNPVPKDEAEQRIADTEARQRKERGETDRERLMREEREIKLNAAKVAAERSGLTGAIETIQAAEDDLNAQKEELAAFKAEAATTGAAAETPVPPADTTPADSTAAPTTTKSKK